MVTGYLACIGVLGALAKRAQGGSGQWIDASMFASAVAMQQMNLAGYFADGVVPTRIGSAAPYAAPNEAVRCADGWIMLAAYHPSRWGALCDVLESPELLSDPRFADLSGRIAHRDALVKRLEERMALRLRDEWLQRFEAADIICAPINDYAELVASPVFADALITETVEHPIAGRITIARTPLRAVGEIPAARRPAPLAGQHTQEVIQEAGISLEP